MNEGIQLDRIAAGRAHAPVVYFLALYFQGRPAIKIGTSTRLKARVPQLSYGTSWSDVLLLVPGDREVETAYHQRFRPYHIRLELFRSEGALKEFLYEDVAEYDQAEVREARQAADRAAQRPPGTVTVVEAYREGLYPSLQAARKALQRAVKYGQIEPVGKDGSAHLFRISDIARLKEK